MPVDVELVAAELSTVGWDRLTNAPVVLLRVPDSESVLPIWIGIAEARAIQMALLDLQPPRPMTHDLMTNLLTVLGAELETVIVHELRGGTYYGLLRVRLEDGGELRWIDTRPSDGLALAARTGARIEVARELLEQVPQFDFEPPEGPQQVVRLLGLTTVAVTDELRRTYDLPERPGIVVTEARDRALAGGLRPGDLILSAQGEAVEEPQDLLDAVVKTPAGEPLRLVYWRDGEERTIELSLVPAPPPEKKVA